MKRLGLIAAAAGAVFLLTLQQDVDAASSNTADTYQQTYGSSWLVPTSVLPARFAKLGVQFDF